MKKGLDAPLIPLLFLFIGIGGVILAIISGEWVNFIFPLLFLLTAIVYMHTSLIGKYRILARIATKLEISDATQILDLGTGHGAFLIEIAKRLTSPAKVIGIDIWKNVDQSHNSLVTTKENIKKLGLTDVSTVKTADMTKLPFTDNSFDYVVSSLALHNVKPKTKRKKALAEAYRVLKPGGCLILVDIEHSLEYQRYLKKLGIKEITLKHAGFNGLYGILSTKILWAKK